MRRASSTAISPWSTGSWRVKPGEIQLLTPEQKRRRPTLTDIGRFARGKALRPFGQSKSSEALIIAIGVMSGFIIGAVIFFTLI